VFIGRFLALGVFLGDLDLGICVKCTRAQGIWTLTGRTGREALLVVVVAE
jgi:hypothetical protein